MENNENFVKRNRRRKVNLIKEYKKSRDFCQRITKRHDLRQMIAEEM